MQRERSVAWNGGSCASSTGGGAPFLAFGAIVCHRLLSPAESLRYDALGAVTRGLLASVPGAAALDLPAHLAAKVAQQACTKSCQSGPCRLGSVCTTMFAKAAPSRTDSHCESQAVTDSTGYKRAQSLAEVRHVSQYFYQVNQVSRTSPDRRGNCMQGHGVFESARPDTRARSRSHESKQPAPVLR